MAVAGGSTFYSDYATLAQASTKKPLVKLLQQSGQSIASGTDVALTFGSGSEDIDTDGFHDIATNTSRITPTVAGYYRLTGMIVYASDTDLIDWGASIGKNATVIARARLILPSTATASTGRTINVTTMSAANGTTDYFELFARQIQAAAASLNTAASSGFQSIFECEFLRPL